MVGKILIFGVMAKRSMSYIKKGAKEKKEMTCAAQAADLMKLHVKKMKLFWM